jgi:hypothetical protein
MKRNLIIEKVSSQNMAHDLNNILGKLYSIKINSLIIYYNKDFKPLFFYYNYEYNIYIFATNLNNFLQEKQFICSNYFALYNVPTKIIFILLEKYYNITHGSLIRLSYKSKIYIEAEKSFNEKIKKVSI